MVCVKEVASHDGKPSFFRATSFSRGVPPERRRPTARHPSGRLTGDGFQITIHASVQALSLTATASAGNRSTATSVPSFQSSGSGSRGITTPLLMIPLITVTSSSVSYRLAVAGDKFAPGKAEHAPDRFEVPAELNRIIRREDSTDDTSRAKRRRTSKSYQTY